MDYVVKVLLIWFLCLLSVFLHELGHALGYRISAGKAGWKVRAGSGPAILSTAKFTFCLIPAGGYFVPEEEPRTKKANLAMLAGGPLVSLLLTALFCVCRFCLCELIQPGSELCDILFPVSNFLLCFNFFQFLFTAVPMRYRVVCRGFQSDGLQIVHALKHKKS